MTAPEPEQYGFDVVLRKPGIWTRVAQALGILIIVAAFAGMVQGATYTPQSSATGTSFLGHSAVVAQLAAANVIRECGTQTHTITKFSDVAPPFSASNAVAGPALSRPGADISMLVSCLTKKYEPRGFTVSKCPVAATSVGTTADRLASYITAEVMCVTTNGGA